MVNVISGLGFIPSRFLACIMHLNYYDHGVLILFDEESLSILDKLKKK